jgi:hypothetical protein
MSLLAAYKCGRTLVDMKAACAAAADCVGFTRLDTTADAYATGCGFTVSQDTSMRHYTFHKNKNISGSPPVVAGPLDDVDYGDAVDGFYMVKGLPLGDVTGYAAAAASCAASTPEQMLECDAMFDCVGFSRRRSGCAYWIMQDSGLRAYDVFHNKKLVGAVPEIRFDGPFDNTDAKFGGLYAGTYMVRPREHEHEHGISRHGVPD